MTHHEFVTDSMIRGYHIFRTIWDAVIGERLQCVRKVSNVEYLQYISIFAIQRLNYLNKVMLGKLMLAKTIVGKTFAVCCKTVKVFSL